MPTRSHQRPASCSAVTSTRRTWPRWRSATRPTRKAASTRRSAPRSGTHSQSANGPRLGSRNVHEHCAGSASGWRTPPACAIRPFAGEPCRSRRSTIRCIAPVGRPPATADHRACAPRRRTGARSDFRAPARVSAWPSSRRAAARCKQREPVRPLVLARPRSDDRQQYPARRTSPTSLPG